MEGKENKAEEFLNKHLFNHETEDYYDQAEDYISKLSGLIIHNWRSDTIESISIDNAKEYARLCVEEYKEQLRSQDAEEFLKYVTDDGYVHIDDVDKYGQIIAQHQQDRAVGALRELLKTANGWTNQHIDNLCNQFKQKLKEG